MLLSPSKQIFNLLHDSSRELFFLLNLRWTCDLISSMKREGSGTVLDLALKKSSSFYSSPGV